MRHVRWVAAVPVAALLVGGVALAGSLTGANAATGAPAKAAPAAAAAQLAAAPKLAAASPALIKKAALAAAATASSMHVAGVLLDGTEELGLNVTITTTGATGTLTDEDGAMVVRRVGAKVWIQPNAEEVTALGLPASLVQGKWVVVPTTQSLYKQIITYTSLPFWAGSINALKPTKKAKGPVYAGIPSVALIQPGPKGGSLYVAVKGQPFPRAYVSADKKTRVAFSAWNATVAPIVEPTAAEILSLSFAAVAPSGQ